MALIVEDGTGKSDADALVDLDFAEAYFAGHGSPADWTTASDPDKEAAIRYATQDLCARPYRGRIAKPTQALAFPRTGIVDDEGRAVPSSVVPTAIKHATCERARAHLSDPIEAEAEDEIEAVDLDGLAVDFIPAKSAPYPYIEKLLAPYLTPGAGSGWVRSIRG